MTREEKQENYSDGADGLAPLTWGRMKIGRRATGTVDVSEEDMPDIGAALYLEEYSKLRAYPKDPAKFIAACVQFARTRHWVEVAKCGMALAADMEAFEASEIKPVDESPGKPVAGVDVAPLPASPCSVRP